jgi:hypothetical protein
MGFPPERAGCEHVGVIVDRDAADVKTPGRPRALQVCPVVQHRVSDGAGIKAPTFGKRMTTMGGGILLWLLGIPIPIIILLLLFFH